jgi:hypothetical protein
MRWDIFCQIVDNNGDAGVCWRLARALSRLSSTSVNSAESEDSKEEPVPEELESADEVIALEVDQGPLFDS